MWLREQAGRDLIIICCLPQQRWLREVVDTHLYLITYSPPRRWLKGMQQ